MTLRLSARVRYAWSRLRSRTSSAVASTSSYIHPGDQKNPSNGTQSSTQCCNNYLRWRKLCFYSTSVCLSLCLSVCLSILLRSQFSLDFDETLHRSLEPKKYDRVRWESKSDHSFPNFPPSQIFTLLLATDNWKVVNAFWRNFLEG